MASNPSDERSPNDEETARFRELIGRIAAGDALAQTEFSEEYKTPVLAYIKNKFRGQEGLRRFFSSEDILLSVMNGALQELGPDGRYKIDNPKNLIALLLRFASNKFISRVIRPNKNAATNDGGLDQTVDSNPPEQLAIHNELVTLLDTRLQPQQITVDMRDVLRLCVEGHSWADIHRQVLPSQQALTKRFRRAVREILGTDETGE